MSGGESDLEQLLKTLNPILHPDRYTFAQSSEPVLPPNAFALVREDEGVTIITTDPAGEWAHISLGVHSSLEAVALTAELSRRLSEAGISTNIVAALRHDHLFVPWDRREEAKGLLTQVSAPAR